MSTKIEKPAVAFVCVNAYPLFDYSAKAPIGGMETRAALFARAIASTGRWRVSFAVNDFGQPKRTEHEGIIFDIYQPLHRQASENVNPRFTKRRYFPILNFDRRDISLLWQIPLLAIFRFLSAWSFPLYWRYRRPNVVCCFGNNEITAQVIADCRRLGIKTVLCIASDSDLDSGYRADEEGLNDYLTPKWMAHYALTAADHIYVQTEIQLKILARRFGRTSEVIKNPVQININDKNFWPSRKNRKFVLWIGRSDTFHKRPLLLVQLAKRCPDLPFVMIVNKTHTDVFETIQAEAPHNLTIIERVPHSQIWNYYRDAKVFVSTSAYEGFPNTFLQCAVTGVPVASLEVDPDEMLSTHRCGLLANGDLEKLEHDIRTLWTNENFAESYARNFHKYALMHHSFETQTKQFETLLNKAIEAPGLSALPWWHQPHRRFVRLSDQ